MPLVFIVRFSLRPITEKTKNTKCFWSFLLRMQAILQKENLQSLLSYPKSPVFPWGLILFQRIKYHLSLYAQLRHITSTN